MGKSAHRAFIDALAVRTAQLCTLGIGARWCGVLAIDEQYIQCSGKPQAQFEPSRMPNAAQWSSDRREA
jgi:hypothetical protein